MGGRWDRGAFAETCHGLKQRRLRGHAPQSSAGSLAKKSLVGIAVLPHVMTAYPKTRSSGHQL